MTSSNAPHDRVLDHTRLQLSALFDGELALDEARFLERRLQHDEELAGCVSRWQMAGDILRGQATAAAPAGFAGRVSAALAAETAARPQQAASPRSRWGWGSGAALAASVAVVALFMARQSPAPSPADTAAQVEIASAAPVRQALPGSPVPASPQVPDTAAQLAAATVAVAEVPRRAARRASTRSQAQRAATTRTVRALDDAAQPRRAVASAAPAPAHAAGPVNPFAPEVAAATPRPWPRALLPNAGAAFNVGYGTLQQQALAEVEPAHPFRPRPATLQQPSQQGTLPSTDIPSPR